MSKRKREWRQSQKSKSPKRNKRQKSVFRICQFRFKNAQNGDRSTRKEEKNTKNQSGIGLPKISVSQTLTELKKKNQRFDRKRRIVEFSRRFSSFFLSRFNAKRKTPSTKTTPIVHHLSTEFPSRPSKIPPRRCADKFKYYLIDVRTKTPRQKNAKTFRARTEGLFFTVLAKLKVAAHTRVLMEIMKSTRFARDVHA